MGVKRILLTVFILFIFLWNGTSTVFAMNTGFSTEDMESGDQQIFLSNVKLSLITEEPEKQAITCFDVNDDGLVVVGSEDSTKKIVLVYDSDGTFQYGYAFNCSGSFGLEWDNNNIIIYFVRSSVAATFDARGTYLELKKIQDTTNNNYYWNHFVNATKRTINGEQYIMRNNMGLLNLFASSYSQLIKIDADENIINIYDVSSEYNIKFIVVFVAVILFLVFIASKVLLQFVKFQKENLSL